MIPWLRACGEILPVGVAYATATSFPGTFRRSPASDRERPTWVAACLIGCLFAVATRPLVASLSLSTAGLVLALWLLLSVLGFLMSMIEAAAFSDGPSPIRRRHAIGAVFGAAIIATAAGLLNPAPSSASLLTNVEQWIARYGWTSWTLRALGSAVAFMVAYCVLGTLTWRFVRPYYTDPKYGLRLRIPPGSIVVLLQIGRGLLALVALAPLLASTSAHGVDAWGRWALALAVTSGVIPLLGARGWPAYLRIVHSIEIVLFALVYAFALVRIFEL